MIDPYNPEFPNNSFIVDEPLSAQRTKERRRQVGEDFHKQCFEEGTPRQLKEIEREMMLEEEGEAEKAYFEEQETKKKEEECKKGMSAPREHHKKMET